MPTLPPPPAPPAPDHGWLTQTLPLAGSLASIGVLSATTGHALVAVVMIGATVLATGAQLDHQAQQRRRELARLRREYDATLACLAPSPDWSLPGPALTPALSSAGSSTGSSARADPVCRLLAERHVARLRSAGSLLAPPRDGELCWGHEDLRAELSDQVWLDLREAAAGGVGPHGVIVGATGSGKSELLRALVLSLAQRHSPSEVTFLLIDFKAGTALGDLEALPHCAGLITNLSTDDHLVPRMLRALDAELDRRQQAVRAGERIVPLVVVVDEFSELLSAHPEVTAVLTRIGRLGRSLGLHLVLASQRLEETRLRELEAHLSWRLALRTFTDAESRAVLGTPDAARLPREPGWALLRTGPDEPQRFRVTPAPDAFVAQVLGRLGALGDRGPRAAPVWLAPLQGSPRLEELLASSGAAALGRRPRTGGDPGGGSERSVGESPSSALEDRATVWGTEESTCGREESTVPIGLIDDPTRRRVVEVGADRGHLAIIGRPGSGKSSLITTIEAALRDRRPWLRLVRLDPRRAELPSLSPGTVVLADDWSVLHAEQPLVEDALVRAAVSTPGVRIILAAQRWADVRPALRDLLETRIELRLADPLDSLLDRRLAAAVPPRQPGRGLIEGEHFVAAVTSPDPTR